MLKQPKPLYLLIFFICLHSCVYRDDGFRTEELGDGYFFVDDNHGKPQICKEVRPSSHTYYPIVYHKVEDYSFNDNFILGYRHVTNKELIGGKSDSMLAVQNVGDTLQYWIIEKRRDNVFGPLNEEEFQTKRQELNIPSTLTLKTRL